jgi:hypothetical protein
VAAAELTQKIFTADYADIADKGRNTSVYLRHLRNPR